MKVAITVPNDVDVWNFHRGLVTALLDQRLDVSVICPAGSYAQRFQSWGAKHIPIHLKRFSSPVSDMKLLQSLSCIFRQERFDIVHNHTVKPNIYGTLAARQVGIPTVLGSVRGMGSMFTDVPGLKRRLLRTITLLLYQVAFRRIDRVQFLNGDDLSFFVSRHILTPDKAVLIKSSGVNLRRFDPSLVDAAYLETLRAHLGLDKKTLVVVMVARAYWSKGVREFVTAAEMLGTHHRAVFLLIGAVEHGPDAVPEAYLHQHESSEFRWLGFREDIRELLALADVVVLPSYYPEGVPKSLLEAMAMQKPIVTTDNRGCREVVEDGKNGWMVPSRDATALATAISRLLDCEPQRVTFGNYSRQKVEQEFDETLIVNKVLTDLYGFQA